MSLETLGNHKIDSNHHVSSKVFIQVPSDVINNNRLFQLAPFLNKPVTFLIVTLSFPKSNCRLKTPGIYFFQGACSPCYHTSSDGIAIILEFLEKVFMCDYYSCKATCITLLLNNWLTLLPRLKVQRLRSEIFAQLHVAKGYKKVDIPL